MTNPETITFDECLRRIGFTDKNVEDRRMLHEQDIADQRQHGAMGDRTTGQIYTQTGPPFMVGQLVPPDPASTRCIARIDMIGRTVTIADRPDRHDDRRRRSLVGVHHNRVE